MPFFGVCYGPYHRTNSGPPSPVSERDVDADMAIIAARGFTHIRTYGTADGNLWAIDKAGKHGLKVAEGVSVAQDNVVTLEYIDHALGQAEKAATTYALYGNPALIRQIARGME